MKTLPCLLSCNKINCQCSSSSYKFVTTFQWKINLVSHGQTWNVRSHWSNIIIKFRSNSNSGPTTICPSKTGAKNMVPGIWWKWIYCDARRNPHNRESLYRYTWRLRMNPQSFAKNIGKNTQVKKKL